MDSPSKHTENVSGEISFKENSKQAAETEGALEHVDKDKNDFPKESSELKCSDELSLAENSRKTETDPEGGALKLKAEIGGLEKQQASELAKSDKDYNDVKVELIDIPEDEDLFDFLDKSPSDKEDELKKTELYKYLTNENEVNTRSEEVTPDQSGDEHEEAGSESSSSSSSDDSSSDDDGADDDEYEEIIEEKVESESHGERKEAVLPEEEPVSETKVRRNPGRKSSAKRSESPKTLESSSSNLTNKTLERLEKCKQVTNMWLQDLCIPENLTFSQPLKIKIGELNQYITCGLCKGYLYEASTITECMHTFCKNCIVRHCMEVSLHCPVCHILIHPTDPFVNIRLDRMIQDIVYKILPRVADTEMKRIEEFYAEHPEVEPREMQKPPPKPKVSPKEEEPEEVKPADHVVSLLLEAEEHYLNQEELEKKFVRVSSKATVGSVCTFLKRKLSLQDSHEVDIFCCGDAMEESQCTLATIKQNFYSEQEEPMLLQYRIRET